MIPSIQGHDKWLNPPDEITHRVDCSWEETGECSCLDLMEGEAEAQAEDMAMERYYAEKYGD